MEFLNNFAESHPWIPLAIGIYLVIAKAIVGVRDSLDKSPTEDNNLFERIATIVGKTIGYMSGIRPSAPKGSVVVPGENKDAVGTKVK